jgi:hypothetical protein
MLAPAMLAEVATVPAVDLHAIMLALNVPTDGYDLYRQTPGFSRCDFDIDRG